MKTSAQIVQDLKSELDNSINHLQKDISHHMERLNSNFLFNAKWVFEDTLKSNLKLKELSLLLETLHQEDITKSNGEVLKGTDQNRLLWFRQAVKHLEAFTSKSHNVMSSSTCSVTNLQTTLTFMVKLEVQEEMNHLLNFYS